MSPVPWGTAIDEVLADDRSEDRPDDRPVDDTGGVVLVVPTPAGRQLDQRLAAHLAGRRRLIVACGRYEGIDQRVAEHYRSRPETEVLELSIGDYVLNGGEVAALVLVEAVARLLPGVIGNPESLVEESHGDDGAALLEAPVFTRPATWRGLDVPAELLSGDHGRADSWRRRAALERTIAIRPDLLRTRRRPEALGLPGAGPRAGHREGARCRRAAHPHPRVLGGRGARERLGVTSRRCGSRSTSCGGRWTSGRPGYFASVVDSSVPSGQDRLTISPASGRSAG